MVPGGVGAHKGRPYGKGKGLAVGNCPLQLRKSYPDSDNCFDKDSGRLQGRVEAQLDQADHCPKARAEPVDPPQVLARDGHYELLDIADCE